MSRSILFITTLNLASNPRLVKEIDLALTNSFNVTVICFEFNNWSKKNNDLLINQYKGVRFISIPSGKSPFMPWFVHVFKEKIYRVLGMLLPLRINHISQAVSRRSGLLIKAIKKVDKADLVIGHNPGALYPALFAAKKFNCQAGFDMEDYHSGEGQNKHLKSLTKLLIEKTLSGFNYVSFASELIKNKVQSDLNCTSANWFTIMNYFQSSEFVEPVSQADEKIRFVWFSQNINPGRGLEEFIEIFKEFDNCELHLYGNLDNSFFDNTLSKIENIFIHQPLPQKQLHRELYLYDIGLALDIAHDENRDFAITNKVLAYLQSGLFVVASNISAHRYVLDQYKEYGVCLTDIHSDNIRLLVDIFSNKNKIREDKIFRYEKFKKNCWENESEILQLKWKSLLN